MTDTPIHDDLAVEYLTRDLDDEEMLRGGESR